MILEHPFVLRFGPDTTRYRMFTGMDLTPDLVTYIISIHPRLAKGLRPPASGYHRPHRTLTCPRGTIHTAGHCHVVAICRYVPSLDKLMGNAPPRSAYYREPPGRSEGQVAMVAG